MATAGNESSVQHYPLQASMISAWIERALHVLIGIAIVVELRGGMLILVLAFFAVLAWRYFAQDSSAHAIPTGSAIELNLNQATIIWRQPGRQQRSYPAAETRVIMSRYFVLLALGRRGDRTHKILLPDSFDSINRYTRFRRQIKEIHKC